MSDPATQARTQLEDSARSAAAVASAAVHVTEAARAGVADDVAAFATALFDQLMAGAAKKGEDPAKAAKKITKIALARAEREAAAKAAGAPQDPPPAPEGQGVVTGKASGVNRKILSVLRAVSAHYNEPIRIQSGKRDPKATATAIFMNWNGHLRQGKALPYFRKTEKLRSKLDALKQEKNRSGFEEHLLNKADVDLLSPHMVGDAVDLPSDTPDHIIEALATCLNYKSEKNTEGKRVHHFDVERVVWPIPDSARSRWPEV